MPKLTLNIPPSISKALAEESSKRGKSLDQTVLEILSQFLEIKATKGEGEARETNGLERYAGRWSEEEFREFEAAVAPFAGVDQESWSAYSESVSSS